MSAKAVKKSVKPKAARAKKAAKTVKKPKVVKTVKAAKIVIQPEAPVKEVKAVELPDNVKIALTALSDKKGEGIKLLDVRSSTPMWDYFIVCGGTSSVHVGALRDSMKKDMAAAGYVIAHEDRGPELKWLVVDFGDILVHIFEKETRHYYNLESMWTGHEVDVSHIIKE